MGISRSEADKGLGQRDATPVGGDVVPGGFKAQQEGFLKRGLADSITGLNNVAGLQRQDDRFAGGAQGHLAINNNPEVRAAVTAKRRESRDFNLARREAIRRNDRLGAAMIGQHARKSGLQIGGIRQYGADHAAAANGINAGRIDAGQKYQSKLGHLDRQANQGQAVSSRLSEEKGLFGDLMEQDNASIEGKNTDERDKRLERLRQWMLNGKESLENKL